MLYHWQGAELAKPFAKALSPSPVASLRSSPAHPFASSLPLACPPLVRVPPRRPTPRWIPPRTKLGRLPAAMHEALRAIWVTIHRARSPLCVAEEDFARTGESADLIPPPCSVVVCTVSRVPRRIEQLPRPIVPLRHLAAPNNKARWDEDVRAGVHYTTVRSDTCPYFTVRISALVYDG